MVENQGESRQRYLMMEGVNDGDKVPSFGGEEG